MSLSKNLKLRRNAGICTVKLKHKAIGLQRENFRESLLHQDEAAQRSKGTNDITVTYPTANFAMLE